MQRLAYRPACALAPMVLAAWGSLLPAAGADAYEARLDALTKLISASAPDSTKAEAETHRFLADYPHRFGGELGLMLLAWNAELAGRRDLERAWAMELAGRPSLAPGEVPDWVGSPRAWAEGVTYRIDSIGRTIEMRFENLDGRSVDLAAFRGRVVLIDFWAAWCPPCVAAVPDMLQCYRLNHSRGLEILGISWDLEKAKLRAFVSAHGITWDQDFESSRRTLATRFGVGGIPYGMLVSRKGILRWCGPPEKNELERQIALLIAE